MQNLIMFCLVFKPWLDPPWLLKNGLWIQLLKTGFEKKTR
jgi:hypothetical protein